MNKNNKVTLQLYSLAILVGGCIYLCDEARKAIHNKKQKKEKHKLTEHVYYVVESDEKCTH